MSLRTAAASQSSLYFDTPYSFSILHQTTTFSFSALSANIICVHVLIFLPRCAWHTVFSVMVPWHIKYFCCSTRGTHNFSDAVPVAHKFFLLCYPWHIEFFCHITCGTHNFPSLSRGTQNFSVTLLLAQFFCHGYPWHTKFFFQDTRLTQFFCHGTRGTIKFSVMAHVAHKIFLLRYPFHTIFLSRRTWHRNVYHHYVCWTHRLDVFRS
jgi:hypothetical protein